MASVAGGIGNPLSQLEESWGKPRDSWSIEDWRKAAELMEKSLVVMGGQVDAVMQLAALITSKPARRRGRPRKSVGMVKVKLKQPLSQRHTNFGEKKAVFDKLAMMSLVAAVERQQGNTDAAKLAEIVKKLHQTKRKTLVDQDVKNQWGPRLSKARKMLTNDERNAISTWCAKNK